MLTWFEVYLWTRLDILVKVFGMLSFVFLICLLFYMIELEDGNWAKRKKYFFAQLTIGAILGFLAIVIPNQKDFALIYILPKIVNNEKVQQIPDKFLDFANKKLDELLADGKGGK